MILKKFKIFYFSLNYFLEMNAISISGATKNLKSSHYLKTLAGVEMPRLIYGTAWKKEKTTNLVVQAVLQGFRGIDTACQPKHYREDLVGEALNILAKDHNFSRDSLFIQTKFTPLSGQDLSSVPYDPSASLSDQVLQSLEKSLSNLKSEYIDSLLIHSPMVNYSDTLQVWKIFEEFVNQGKVKQIGISNIYKLDLLKKIWLDSSIKPSVIQNRFYRDSFYDYDIRKFCKEKGIIYQSFWTLTANPDIVNSSNVKSISNKRGCTNEQIIFKLLVQLGYAPLTGTTSQIHMKQDLDVLEMDDLTTEDIKNISDLFSGLLLL
jgi:diketogulonate reductase-like aldo/keto reductase